MGKRISNYEELPFANKKVYNLIVSNTNGNISMFAESIGVSQQVLERIFRKDKRSGKYPKVSDGIKEALKNKFNINDFWFLDESSNAIEIPLKEKEEGNFYTESHNGVSFYELPNGKYRMEVDRVPWCAYGRFANECDTLEPDKDGWGKESFYTDKIVHGRYLAFEVRGDSMDDGTRASFEEGDVVLVRELDRIHWRDGIRFKERPYWVVVFDSSVLIKQIVAQNLETGELTFHSLNNSPEYSDFRLNMDQIRALYYVLQKKPKTVTF